LRTSTPRSFIGELERIVERVVPGLAVAVVGPEGTRWASGVGTADIGAEIPATPSMACSWYSMTKVVTATAVVQLAERGAMGLNDPVAQHLHIFKELRPADRAERITVGHLLSHSSGLANPIPIRWVHPPEKPGPDPEQFLAKVLVGNRGLRFEPGSRSSYSNIGYLALGQVVAAVSNRSYEAYVTDQILQPLGMTNTGFLFTESMSRTAATPYHRRVGMMRLLLPQWVIGSPQDGFISLNRFVLDGAAYGGLVGPVTDAARFLQMHLRDGELDGVRILSADGARHMREIRVRGRVRDLGLGWFRPRRARNAEPAYVEHLGGGAGYWNDMRIYPDLSLGVVMMGNSTKYDHEAVNRAILDEFAKLHRA
jgi:CubicO group peptidase (beta-lactamase class C family)